MPRLAKIVTSLFLAFHLLAIGAGALAGAAPADWWIRNGTGGYLRLVGVYQNWNLFAPSPPRRDRWLVFEGQSGVGAWSPLPPLMGPRPDVAIELRYRRAGKLERQLLPKRRRDELRGVARWYCDHETDPRRVRAIEVAVRQPTPDERLDGQRPTLEVEGLLAVTCP